MDISSDKVKYSEEFIDVIYDYSTTYVEKDNGKLIVSTLRDNVDGLKFKF